MQKSIAKDMRDASLIPDKLFYKIGEVSKIAGVEPYVLRYWETEFPFLKPRKSKSGQRIYVKKDLDLIFQIKDLLYKERFTIEGVRKKFSSGGASSKAAAAKVDSKPADVPQLSMPKAENPLEHVKKRLQDILDRMG
ncbi:MAG: MerR family transcriptional regulator [Thermodesulfovibrionales bacterium]|nr:MerR family transcriptional regulator [Thermodesulfovibrionales bacterium]